MRTGAGGDLLGVGSQRHASGPQLQLSRARPTPSTACSSRAARVGRTCPSFRDFVDAVLFDPAWGYYSTGRVRFGEGGHYDTFPTALSPLFGRMVAHAARCVWLRAGRPRRFEVCEIGAGNGRLCLDTLVAVQTRTRRPDWRAFATALRYRIVERSPALVARQQAQLGPLAARVVWTRADLSSRALPRLPLGAVGFVVANEVLDCLAHHKIVAGRDGRARVVFVAATLPGGHSVPRSKLGRVLAGPDRRRLRFREVALPLDRVPGLRAFLVRHCPERLLATRPFPPYFACPQMAALVRNVGRLYRTAEMVWIDYGDLRPFHLHAAERRRVFAGPPRSGRSVYDDPGRDDITFMVDFTVVAEAARDAGLTVEYFGGQRGLATASGVRLDARAVELIVQSRAVGWMLDLMGLGPERAWRQGGVTWTRAGARGGRLRDGVVRDVEEFLGRRPSRFKMMTLATDLATSRRRAAARARRRDC